MNKSAMLSAVAALVAMGGVSMAHAGPKSTYIVDDDGMASIGNCDSSELASNSIQVAIDMANDATKRNKRDLILVCPGTYEEQVVVDKSVILKGVADSPASYPVVDGTNGNTIEITADGVTVAGFKITNDFIGSTGGRGIDVYSSGNEITNNWITFTDIDGIRLNEDADGNYIWHNIVEDSDNDCIRVASSHNDIGHNIVTRCDDEGIDLFAITQYNSVHHNTVTFAEEDGIEVKGDNNDIHFNTVMSNGLGGDAGILLNPFAEDNTVQFNNVTNNVEMGIEAVGDRNDIRSNFVCGHSLDVVVASGADANRVRFNTFDALDDSGTGTKVIKNSLCP